LVKKIFLIYISVQLINEGVGFVLVTLIGVGGEGEEGAVQKRREI